MRKYVNLHTESQGILNKSVKIMPVIIGTTCLIENNLKTHISGIQYSIKCTTLRSAMLGTAHILRKVLSNKPNWIVQTYKHVES